MWGRLRAQWELLEGAAGDREQLPRDAKCQRFPYSRDAEVGLRRSSSGKWTATGLVSCGLGSCTCCGPRRTREHAPKLAVALQRWLQRDAWHDVAMLTLAPPHRADDDLELLIDQLTAATGWLWRTKAWRDFARRWGVEARVRGLDGNHGGAHGSHPHFHVLLFFTRASIPIVWAPPAPRKKRRWDRWELDEDREQEIEDDVVRALAGLETRVVDRRTAPCAELLGLEPLRHRDRATRIAYLEEASAELLDAWERACVEAGIAIRNRDAFRRYSLKLSPGESAASYILRWGLADEVGAPDAKARSHLRLLDLVQAGHARAGEIYLAWRRATRGHAWLTGQGDLYRRLEVTDDDGAAYLQELHRRREKLLAEAGTPVVRVRELELEVPRLLLPIAIRLGWDEVFAAVDDADRRGAGDLQAELEMFLRRSASRRAPRSPPVAEGERHVRDREHDRDLPGPAP